MSHLDRLLERAPVQPAQPLHLHIDSVSIAGVALTPPQSRRFEAALRQELQQLARAPGWPAGAASTMLPGVIAPAVALGADGSPAALGRDVARSLFDAVRRAR